MDGLYSQFKLLFANVVHVADLVSSRKGGIVFEWPANNRLWQEKEVIDMLRKYGLQRSASTAAVSGFDLRKGSSYANHGRSRQTS